MPPYYGWAKSKFRPGYNWSESSVIIQKEKKILDVLNSGLNLDPMFEKMPHRVFLQIESNLILSPNPPFAKTIGLRNGATGMANWEDRVF